MKTLQILAKVALGFSLGAAMFPAYGADATPAGPRFEVARYEVDGNTLLSPTQIETTLTPFTGKSRGFADVEAARQALQRAYILAGYGAVIVTLPEQELKGGVVRFAVLEAKIGRIEIVGNKFFDEANIRASLPSLKEGTPPNTRSVAHHLRLANESTVKQTNALLTSGDKPGEVNVSVRVQDEKPWRAFATLDNTGTKQTGESRASVGFQHANLFNRDHVLTAQYTTSVEKPKEVTIYGVGYRVPLYGLGDAVEIFAGYSDVNSGTVEGLFNVSGKGTVLGARYQQYFPKVDEYEQRITYGIDHRAFENNVDFQGTPLGTDITIHPISATYFGEYDTAGFKANLNFGLAHNLPGGKKGTAADFEANRMGANANYTILSYGANATFAINEAWLVQAAFNGQYTRDALVSGEQFGLGGYSSVRGFNEREISNDYGHRGSIELHSPEFADKIGLEGTNARALVFYDFGRVTRNKALPSETTGTGVASVGLGLRFAAVKRFSLRVDYGWVVDAGGNQGRGDAMLHAGLTLTF